MSQQKRPPSLQIILILAAACLVFGGMQGIHDNYGLMLQSLMGTSGLGYDQVSFVIGVGALVYGFDQLLMDANHEEWRLASVARLRLSWKQYARRRKEGTPWSSMRA